jgi:hypothetical protein
MSTPTSLLYQQQHGTAFSSILASVFDSPFLSHVHFLLIPVFLSIFSAAFSFVPSYHDGEPVFSLSGQQHLWEATASKKDGIQQPHGYEVRHTRVGFLF